MSKRWRTNQAVQERAQEFRKQHGYASPAEAELWRHLQAKQLNGLKFRRQHPIGRFIVDFYCAAHKLAVEVDGWPHSGRVTPAGKSKTKFGQNTCKSGTAG